MYKTTNNALSELYAHGRNSRSDADPPFDDFQIEVLAAAIAALRAELRQEVDVAEVMRRLAALEGKIELLTTLLGADASRSVETSEVIRKLKVQR